MKDIKTSTTMGLVVFLAFLFLPSVGRTDPIVVNCPGDSIQDKLESAKPGDTLLVSGICNERVRINQEVVRVTLDGQGSATIDGQNLNRPTVNVAGRGITIKGFTITGGSNGILVRRGGEASIKGNTIRDNDRVGIVVVRNSHAQIDNANTITQNRDGIEVIESSAARIENNNIVNNTRDGVVVLRVSTARIRNNSINGNAGDGIFLRENAGVNLRGNSGNNGGFGLSCATGAYASGIIGTLTGASGQTSFDTTCIDNL